MARTKKDKTGAAGMQTAEMLRKKEKEILKVWMENQLANITLHLDLINKGDLEEQSKELLGALTKAMATGNLEDIEATEYKPVIKMLNNISERRADQGFTPSEAATYVFSLLEAILQFLQKEYAGEPEILNQEVTVISKLAVKLGLITFESFVRGKESVIRKQEKALMKMTTPIMIVWENILLLPLVGILDSERTQMVMEMSLKKIADTESKIFILDILGVPAVDTAVANHILKIAKAAKLMGCDCILSGISPEVAQTMVQLGIDTGDINTLTTLKDALRFAFKMQELEVQKVKTKK